MKIGWHKVRLEGSTPRFLGEHLGEPIRKPVPARSVGTMVAAPPTMSQRATFGAPVPGQAPAACLGTATATATSGDILPTFPSAGGGVQTLSPAFPIPAAGAGRGGGGPSSIAARPPPAGSRGGEAAPKGSSASSRAGSGAHGMSDGGFLPGQRFGKAPSLPRGEMDGDGARAPRGELPKRFPRGQTGWRGCVRGCGARHGG